MDADGGLTGRAWFVLRLCRISKQVTGKFPEYILKTDDDGRTARSPKNRHSLALKYGRLFPADIDHHSDAR
jgi:hypothetical protein